MSRALLVDTSKPYSLNDRMPDAQRTDAVLLQAMTIGAHSRELGTEVPSDVDEMKRLWGEYHEFAAGLDRPYTPMTLRYRADGVDVIKLSVEHGGDEFGESLTTLTSYLARKSEHWLRVTPTSAEGEHRFDRYLSNCDPKFSYLGHSAESARDLVRDSILYRTLIASVTAEQRLAELAREHEERVARRGSRHE
ncbi:hypothetical protein [Demequina rhizosphaerae]|uniref:hypothetical protein n=1 Tax=Demequina rhizosphaerae TaxID=1638985 RepID=UPI0007828AD3|nr:hypothetical protein [Demequina rhizosphaerae]